MGKEINSAALEALLSYRAPYKKSELKAEEAGIFNNTVHVGEPIILTQYLDDDDDDDDDDDWEEDNTPF